MARINFDPNTVPADEFEGLAPGEYEVRITESEINPTKAGTGQVLTLVMDVESGPSQGRKHWERFNISNPSAVAEKIGKQKLAKVMKALAIPGPLQDTEELHHKPFIMRLKAQKKDPSAVELSSARPVGGNPPAAAQPPASPPPEKEPAMAGAGAGKKPWD